ncbi:MAG TPA: class I SAM-dependent methyltransferase [Bryobacteraceae bacterium]|nr:class I SAM-dependent methyltransferase [Bryobacteraceae bacterium]
MNLRFWERFRDKTGSAPVVLTPQLRQEIRQSFNTASLDEEHFPSTIDPRIRHVQVLLKFFGDLTDKQLLDVGCGKGRFARVLLESNPRAQISGLDISEDMLACVPAGMKKVAALMTEVPFAASTFDCVYATESLEHAVEIDRAVAEMCRVLKPGGKLVIIDKNAEHWGRFKTPAWERWFSRKELERLLARDCSKVHSEFLSYWEDVTPDGLFLAWFAEK